MKHFLNFLTAVAASSLFSAASAEKAESPVVVELFTSQSCSSCVAAADYFNTLADRRDVVAIGWHVDYWNRLQTRNGRWVDPYSSPANTQRQRRYNQSLRDTSAVYTPQMVVHGAAEAIGSDRARVERLVATQSRRAPAADIAVENSGAPETFRIHFSGKGEARIVYLKPFAQTPVRGGENAGVSFIDRNIATRIVALGPVSGIAEFTAETPADGERCAILLQAPNQGPMLAAQYCPER